VSNVEIWGFNSMKLLTLKLHSDTITDDNGFVLVSALMIIVVLSVIQLYLMNVSNTEIKIAANEEVMKHNFYSVETLGVEAGSAIEDAADSDLRDKTRWTAGNNLQWITEEATPDLEQNANWAGNSVVSGYTGVIAPGYVLGVDRILYAAQDLGIAKGSDASDPDKITHAYALYGLYDVSKQKQYSGKSLLGMGYKRDVYNY